LYIAIICRHTLECALKRIINTVRPIWYQYVSFVENLNYCLAIRISGVACADFFLRFGCVSKAARNPFPLPRYYLLYGEGIVMFGIGAPGQPKVGAAGWDGHRVRPPDPLLHRRRRHWYCRQMLRLQPLWPLAAPSVGPVWLQRRPATNSTKNLYWRCRGHTPSTERRPVMTWAPSGTRTYPNRRPTLRLIITVYLYLRFIICL